jgi:PAS domain S-box-containing protein
METGRNRFPWNVTNLSFSWHKVILVCFVAILSYGAAKLGGTLIVGPQAEWPLWLGNAFLVSILLLVPRRMWPILIAAGFSASVLYNVQTGLTVRLSALLVLSDTVEVLAAALCLSYAFGGVPRLNNVRALAKFSLFGVILPPFIGAFCVALSANRNYWMSWRVYFFSEAIVYLTLVPAILGWFSKGSARRQKSRSYYLEAAALIAGLLAFGYVTFDAPWRYSSQALLYSLVPFMLWSALRFGTTGVSASAIVIAVLALWGAAHGRGPFIESQLLNNVLSLQLFLFFTAAPFMVLAAVVEENRQASEQKLRASEERLAETTRLYGELQNREAKIRRLVDANIMGIFIWNLEGKIVEANEAFLNMVQYGREELASGRIRWTDLTPAEWRDRDARALTELMKVGTVQPYEKEFFRKNGGRVPVLAGGALFEESGHEGVAFVLDLSEQKRAEEALRQSEQRWRTAFENSAIGIMMRDREGRFIAANSVFQNMLGYTESELCQLNFMDVTYEEDRKAFLELVGEILEGKRQHYQIEKRYRRKDGALLWVRNNVALVPGTRDVAPFLFAVVEDITQHKQEESARRYSEEKYRVVVDTANDAVITADESGAIQFANPATMRVFGYDPKELIGKPLTVLMPEFMRKLHENGFRRYLATGQRHINWQGTELTGLRKNGQEFPVEVSFGELTMNGHRVFTGFIRDTTERKQAEEERERLRRVQADLAHVNRVSTMGELAASLAHEIRQPISAAMTDARTCSRWLTRDRPDLAEAQTAASRVVNDVARASEIIGRVMSLFKKDSLQHEEVDINELIQEMIALLRGEASRHSILIHSDLSLELAPIKADRVQLQQVLMNLMLNGIEAMKSMNTPGKLTIKSQQDDSGQLLISVMDTGVGIPPEKIEQIFNAFFTSKPQGTGMGLPISRSIIEAHGGKLWASSNANGGATFEFTLPAA